MLYLICLIVHIVLGMLYTILAYRSWKLEERGRWVWCCFWILWSVVFGTLAATQL